MDLLTSHCLVLNIYHSIHAWLWYALFCCGDMINSWWFIQIICPYPSGLLHWHWGNRNLSLSLQCQWSNPEAYGDIEQYRTTTKPKQKPRAYYLVCIMYHVKQSSFPQWYLSPVGNKIHYFPFIFWIKPHNIMNQFQKVMVMFYASIPRMDHHPLLEQNFYQIFFIRTQDICLLFEYPVVIRFLAPSTYYWPRAYAKNIWNRPKCLVVNVFTQLMYVLLWHGGCLFVSAERIE